MPWVLLAMASGMWGYHVIGKRCKKPWQKHWQPFGYDEPFAMKYNWWVVLSFTHFEICFAPFAIRMTLLGWRKLWMWSWLCEKMREGK